MRQTKLPKLAICLLLSAPKIVISYRIVTVKCAVNNISGLPGKPGEPGFIGKPGPVGLPGRTVSVLRVLLAA